MEGSRDAETERRSLDLPSPTTASKMEVQAEVPLVFDNIQWIPKVAVGLDHAVDRVQEKLLDKASMGIVGMGGVGKTTFSRAVFNRLCPTFEHSCFVPNMKFIGGGVENVKRQVWNHLHYCGKRVVSEKNDWSVLTGKLLLLVLDDVAQDRDLDVISILADEVALESRFIVTSRDQGLLLKYLDWVYVVPLLNTEDATQLFMSHAFPNRAVPPVALKTYVDFVVSKCDGSPLALEVLGKYFKKRENEEIWEQVLKALDQSKVVWNLDEKLLAGLRSTYNDRKEREQQMFLHAATVFAGNVGLTLREAKVVWSITYGNAHALWQNLVDCSLVYDVQEDEPIKVHEQGGYRPRVWNRTTTLILGDDLQALQTQEKPVAVNSPWTKVECLGASSFGTVYEAVDSDGTWFAVKEVSVVEQGKRTRESVAQLMQEIELLSQLKHDNIVRYLGTEKAHGNLYIFLELVSKGSVATVYKRITLSHAQISAYTRQILKGLKYLHDQGIVHRDIKCANILVDVWGTCKLADFGLAKQLGLLDQMKSTKGSAYWMAPEVIDPSKTYGPPADIWSLGCSIIEMATGSPPFRNFEWFQVVWKVGRGEVPPIPDSLSEPCKDFVEQCLEINPMRRLTATELLDHPFVQRGRSMTSRR